MQTINCMKYFFVLELILTQDRIQPFRNTESWSELQKANPDPQSYTSIVGKVGLFLICFLKLRQGFSIIVGFDPVLGQN